MLFYNGGIMQKFNLQTLLVFSFGLIFGLCVKFSFITLLALLIALTAVFIYTMRDATGLKHHQDTQFVVISAILYLTALLLSPFSIVVLILFTVYEISNERPNKKILLRLSPVFIITLLVLIRRAF
jgi:hypothetical protein